MMTSGEKSKANPELRTKESPIESAPLAGRQLLRDGNKN